MSKVTPIKFLKQVRQEFSKITWPDKKQALMSTGMVFVMVVITAIYFFLVDWLLSTAVTFFLGLGG